MKIPPLIKRPFQRFVEERPRLRDRASPWLAGTEILLAFLALLALLLRYGTRLLPFGPGLPLDWTIIAINLAFLFASGLLAPSALEFLRLRWISLAVGAGAAVAGLCLEHEGVGLYVWMAALFLLKLEILARVVRHGVRALIDRLRPNAQLVFLASFLLVILTGAILLLLPASTVEGKRLGLVDAVFTATSATCVTGLGVVDTGGTFTRTGQWVILGLMQVGGLGLMTMMAFASVALGRGLTAGERFRMRETLSLGESNGRLKGTLVFILAFTLVFEGAGAALLYGSVPWPAGLAEGDRVFGSLFHAVSAFCNAGFSLQPDSITGWRASPIAVAVMMALIVAGGLGFVVHQDLWDLLRARLRGRYEGPVAKLSVQTLIVLPTTAALLLSGAVALWLLEADGALAGTGPFEAAWNAIFTSVTARTAGFNVVDTAALSDAGLYLVMLLMFIGASPGSTGGGVKTSTIVLTGFFVRSILLRREDVLAFRREIPRHTVEHALLVVVLGAVLVGVSAFFLLATQDGAFRDLLFEAVSAFATVGLSTGVTPGLDATGKLALCLLMLLGRIGPLTLVLAMAGRRRAPVYNYPAENVMIG